MKRLTVLALAGLLSVHAFAFFVENEPNDTRSAPDSYVFDASNGYIAPWSDVGVLSLTPGDSDFFAIFLNAGDYLTAITFPISNGNNDPDTVMALFDGSSNTALVFNDDAGSIGDFGSAIRWQAQYTGYHYLAITGFHGFAGQDDLSYYEGATHTQSGDYILTLSVVPEPAGIIALSTGLVGLLALLRRNRK